MICARRSPKGRFATNANAAEAIKPQGLNCLVGALLAALLAFGTPASAQNKGSPITLVVGEVMTMPVPVARKIIRVGIGNGKLFTVQILEKESQLTFVPENAGRTNLILWTDGGEWSEHLVNVVATNINETVASINAMLKGINGVKAERVGDTVLLSGSTTKINIPRVQTISKLFPLVINAVTDEELEMKRMVHMRVQIVEMKRSLVESLGVSWGDNSLAGPAVGFVSNTVGNTNFRAGAVPSGLSPSAIPVRGFPGIRPSIALTSVITSTINLGVNSGDAFVLASPELSTRSGGKAEFLAGGQVPIVTPGATGSPATVTFKDYGIKLTVEPRADETSNVSTSINTEINSIDSSTAVQGNPGFLTRKTSSEINVKAGQTIVISGLVNSTISKDVSKLAGLGDLPVLGALFRSTNFRSGVTDLVILVTPTVIDPSEDAVKKAASIKDRADEYAREKGLVLK